MLSSSWTIFGKLAMPIREVLRTPHPLLEAAASATSLISVASLQNDVPKQKLEHSVQYVPRNHPWDGTLCGQPCLAYAACLVFTPVCGWSVDYDACFVFAPVYAICTSCRLPRTRTCISCSASCTG
eukprot:1156113-Pelagomonas_calceolata.AAC.3